MEKGSVDMKILRTKKSWMRLLVMLMLAICLSLSGVPLGSGTVKAQGGAAYYVDATGGNDANSGTSPSQAWQTIQKVNQATFAPGDSILFKRGEVWRGTGLVVSSSGVSGAPITYGDYGSGALPKITVASLATNWAGPDANGEYTLANITNGNIVLMEDGKRLTGNTSMSKLPGPLPGSLTPGTWAWNSGAATVYYKPTSGTPADHTVEITVGAAARSGSTNGKSYINIQNIEFYGGFAETLFVGFGGDSVTVSNCIIHSGYRGLEAYRTQNVQLLNNEIYDINYKGIGIMDGSTNGRAAYNYVHDIGKLDTDDGDMEGILVGGGFTQQRPSYDIVEYNTITNIGRDWYKGKNGTKSLGTMSAPGITVDASNHVTVRYNKIHDVWRDGISLGASSADAMYTQVYGNLIYRIGKMSSVNWTNSGIELTVRWNKLDHTQIYNNTIAFGNFFADTIYKQAAINVRVFGPDTQPITFKNSQGQTVTLQPVGSLDDMMIKNNIIAFNQGDYMLNMTIDKGAVLSNFVSDYNDMYRNDGGNAVFWNQNGTTNIYDSNHIIGSTAGYYSYDKGQDTHSLAVDPLFANAAADDYHLLASSSVLSPAIDAGTDVGLTQDLDGNPVPFGTAPDIGAYEYAGPDLLINMFNKYAAALPAPQKPSLVKEYNMKVNNAFDQYMHTTVSKEDEGSDHDKNIHDQSLQKLSDLFYLFNESDSWLSAEQKLELSKLLLQLTDLLNRK